MKRLLILPVVAVVCTAEIYRRGFIAPLMYGARLWYATLVPPEPTADTEPDYMA